jgi:hypothetical protein
MTLLTANQLTRYFMDVSPSHVDAVGDIIEDYAGREAELIADLTAKYKLSPLDYKSSAPDDGEAPSSSLAASGPQSPGLSVYAKSPSKPSFLDAHPSDRYVAIKTL